MSVFTPEPEHPDYYEDDVREKEIDYEDMMANREFNEQEGNFWERNFYA